MIYRVYFNREREWPQCWSIDEGGQETEINVCGVSFGPGVRAVTRTRRAPDVNPGDSSPFAWIEVGANYMDIRGGIAYFTEE